MQHRADQFRKLVGGEARLDRPGLEPHKIEQRRDALAHAHGFLADRVRQCAAILAAERVEIARERGRPARDGGQRRAQVVRDRGQQRIADRLGFGAHLGGLGVGGEIRALERESDLRGKGFQQAELLR